VDGWLPTQVQASEEEDPLMQQISIIRGYIAQAKQQGKMDEVKMLTANLRELEIVVINERERLKTEGANAGQEEEYPDMLNPFAEEES
jgi:hypothetical protein